MPRNLVLFTSPKRGVQGESPVTALLENVHAKLQNLALQIDNGMDDHCIVAKLRQMKEHDEQLNPEDAVDLLNQVRDWILDADFDVVTARSQVSKRSDKAQTFDADH